MSSRCRSKLLMTLMIIATLGGLMSLAAAQDDLPKLSRAEPDLIRMAIDAGDRLGVSPNPFFSGVFPLGDERVLELSRFVPLSGVVLDEKAVVTVDGPEDSVGELFYSKDRTTLYYRVDQKLFSIVVPSPRVSHKAAWLGKIDRSRTRAAFTMKTDRGDGCLLCLVDLENQKVQTAIFSIADNRTESEFERQLFQFIPTFSLRPSSSD